MVASSAAALRRRVVAGGVVASTTNVNAGAGIVLGLAIRRKYFDGVVDARDSEKRFVRVTLSKLIIRRGHADNEAISNTLNNIDDLPITFENVDKLGSLLVPDKKMARVATTNHILIL